MEKKQLFHIIWTVYNEYPIWDKNGNWQKLTATYTELQKQHINYHLYKELQPEYLNKSPRQERLLLDEKAILQLKSDIEHLCKTNGDRIINGLKIEMLQIDKSKVEMLVYSNINVIIQQISRLKSRTATLLHFEYPDKFLGKGTWGKGIWYGNILNKEELAIAMIKNNG